MFRVLQRVYFLIEMIDTTITTMGKMLLIVRGRVGLTDRDAPGCAEL